MAPHDTKGDVSSNGGSRRWRSKDCGIDQSKKCMKSCNNTTASMTTKGYVRGLIGAHLAMVLCGVCVVGGGGYK